MIAFQDPVAASHVAEVTLLGYASKDLFEPSNPFE